jgi:hypothetical protein
MDEYFASTPLTNATLLCVGGITRAETVAAREAGLQVDGKGYYLFLADETQPDQPIEILARFLSEAEASRLARLLGVAAIARGEVPWAESP